MKRFYVDTCILINIFKRETNFWKNSKKFVELAVKKHNVYYSGLILKELQSKLAPEDYKKASKYLKRNFVKVHIPPNEYVRARQIEEKANINFYDILHMLIAKNLEAVLITRDKKLIQLSKNFETEVNTPEEGLKIIYLI